MTAEWQPPTHRHISCDYKATIQPYSTKKIRYFISIHLQYSPISENIIIGLTKYHSSFIKPSLTPWFQKPIRLSRRFLYKVQALVIHVYWLVSHVDSIKCLSKDVMEFITFQYKSNLYYILVALFYVQSTLLAF